MSFRVKCLKSSAVISTLPWWLLLSNKCVLRTVIYESILGVVGEMDRAYSVAWSDDDKQLVQFRYSASTKHITITYMTNARRGTMVHRI